MALKRLVRIYEVPDTFPRSMEVIREVEKKSRLEKLASEKSSLFSVIILIVDLQ